MYLLCQNAASELRQPAAGRVVMLLVMSVGYETWVVCVRAYLSKNLRLFALTASTAAVAPFAGPISATEKGLSSKGAGGSGKSKSSGRPKGGKKGNASRLRYAGNKQHPN